MMLDWKKSGSSIEKSANFSGQLALHLVRGKPAKYGHRNIIAAIQIALHLELQVVKRIDSQVIIKTLLVVSVDYFYFNIVPWCPWTNSLVIYMNFGTKDVQRMNAICFLQCGKTLHRYRSVLFQVHDLYGAEFR